MDMRDQDRLEEAVSRLAALGYEDGEALIAQLMIEAEGGE